MVEPTMLQGFARVYVPFLRLIVVAISDFRDGALSVRATGLVYTTLLSLVPFLAVMFSVLKAFGVHQQIEPFLSQALEPLGPKGGEITDRIIEFVGNLKVGVLGAVGVAGLFYTTFSLIEKIEESLNNIWRVRQSRPLTRKVTDYLSVVLVGPLLVFTAFALTASVQSHWLVQQILEIQPVGEAVVRAAQLMPFVFLCLAFTFFYKFVPHTQVHFVSALVGGATAGILWQLIGMAFTSFVAGSTRYSAIYSGFAILVLFLIWLYVGWLIVLIGAQVAYYHQHPSAFLTLVRWKQNTHAFRERLVLSALMEMARRFYEGGPPYDVAALAFALNVPVAALDELVEECIDYGLVLRTSKPEGIALGRPPEQVLVSDVLESVRFRESTRPRNAFNGNQAIADILQRRDQAIRASLEGVTLQTLAMGQDLPSHVQGSTSLYIEQPLS